MRLETAKIIDLKPHPKNPREHPDSAITKLSRSIKEFGWTNPILVSEEGYVLAGHARLKAAEKAHLTEVPIIRLPLSGKKAEAYMVADNKLQDLTGWDFPKLKDLLEELGTGDFDVEITGFGLKEIGDLVAQFHVPAQGLTDDDEVPEALESICKVGDLWQLGDHRLLCGDATKMENVERLMGGEKADMVFTDPPYNVDYGSSKNPRYKIRNLVSDNQTPEQWLSFNSAFIANIKECCDGDIYCWGASSPMGIKQRLIFSDMGCHWSATIIWNKDQLILTPANYQRRYEPCFYGWFGKSSFQASRSEVEVWDIPRPHNSREHPTMKPIMLCEKGIINSSAYGNIVLDLFGGSGSTLIACEKLNRGCYMMEIDEHYCDVIIQRWQNFTGRRTIKL